ncbi:MAG: hypothetical protein IM638_07735 [Bacteroidetes bacterium]|nr:hypothetical protein [Bacteroidota bacterium]
MSITTPRRRYGVTEKKKSELDNLTLQVLEAQQQVDQFQSIVVSYTSKLANFQTRLAEADTNRTNALNNVNSLNQVIQNFSDLQTNSFNAFNASVEANIKTTRVADNIAKVMNKLIYSVELINKLAVNVARKKALNPLVSDDLVSALNKLGSDANNTIALCMTAMQSVFTAQASSIEAEASFALEYFQANGTYQYILGQQSDGLKTAVQNCFDYWDNHYWELYNATNMVQNQLNQSQIDLAQATLTLQSLQAGLAAGNAAALAS